MFKYFELIKKVFLQIVWPLAIWAKDQNGDIIFDENGKPVPAKVATLIARIASVSLSAFAVTEVLGIPVTEIINFFVTISQYF